MTVRRKAFINGNPNQNLPGFLIRVGIKTSIRIYLFYQKGSNFPIFYCRLKNAGILTFLVPPRGFEPPRRDPESLALSN